MIISFTRNDPSNMRKTMGIDSKQRKRCSPLNGAARRKKERSGVLSYSVGRTNWPAAADPYRSAPFGKRMLDHPASFDAFRL